MSLLLKCKQLSLKLEKYRFIYTLGFSLYEIFNDFLSLFYRLFYIFPIKSNKIVISNISGRGYGESPKYIAEELLKNKDKYDLVWLINSENIDSSEIPSEIRIVKTGTIQSLYELATAKFWIDNTWKQPYVRKRRGQYFIQTWHGYGPKKTIKNPEKEPRLYIESLKRCSKMTDLFTIPNEHFKDLCHSDFWYYGDILESGFPRNDIFFSNNLVEIREKVYSRLNILREKRVLLFAPTYRQNLNTRFIDMIDIEGCLSALNARYGGEWVFLLRLHPLMKDIIPKRVQEESDCILDASSYMDMQELLYVSDILITDYSACMFDFIHTRKPCILYHPDIEEYKDTRGFCIQPDQLPFPRTNSNKELIDCITTFDSTIFEKMLEDWFEKNKTYDTGHASKYVVDWIEKYLK